MKTRASMCEARRLGIADGGVTMIPAFMRCKRDEAARRPVGVNKPPKGTRWMSWRREAMKDVETCEKPRGAGNQAVIRGCPNGETRPARVIAR